MLKKYSHLRSLLPVTTREETSFNKNAQGLGARSIVGAEKKEAQNREQQ